jgi:cupin superfamily acireductone dioxygenase involved in methionine salvage
MEETVDTRPAITPEEFTELRTLQAQQTFLQAQGYQVYNFVANLDAQYAEVQQNYEARVAQAKEQLVALETELSNLNEGFRTRFQEIVTVYGFENVDSVSITDTEPHFISPVDVTVPEAPAEG